MCFFLNMYSKKMNYAQLRMCSQAGTDSFATLCPFERFQGSSSSKCDQLERRCTDYRLMTYIKFDPFSVYHTPKYEKCKIDFIVSRFSVFIRADLPPKPFKNT